MLQVEIYEIESYFSWKKKMAEEEEEFLDFTLKGNVV